MGQVRVPSFLIKTDKEEKKENMELLKIWKVNPITELLVEHLEEELTKLIQLEERKAPLSWFQTRWSRERSLAKREQLRQLIKDLK